MIYGLKTVSHWIMHKVKNKARNCLNCLFFYFNICSSKCFLIIISRKKVKFNFFVMYYLFYTIVNTFILGILGLTGSLLPMKLHGKQQWKEVAGIPEEHLNEQSRNSTFWVVDQLRFR